MRLAAPARPGPPARRVGPRRAHVAVEHVEPARGERARHAAQVGDDRLVGEQVALRVLHADGGVDGTGKVKARHVAHAQVHGEPRVRRPLPEELDVLRREVEAAHPVPALAEADQVRAGAARDVEHGPHATAGEGPEAVNEEVHFLLPVHVEGDLVVAGRRVLARQRRRGGAGEPSLSAGVTAAVVTAPTT